jgi:hypothetical protein
MSLSMCIFVGMYVLISFYIMAEITKMYDLWNILISSGSSVFLDKYSLGSF